MLKDKKINFLFKQYISKTNVVIDVGSNEGRFCQFIKKLYPKSKIYCIEPSLNAYRNLEKKFKENKNIKNFNIALSNKNHNKFFYEYNKSYANSFNVIKPNGFYKNYNIFIKKKIKIKAIKLDLFCKINRIKYVDILKIDCQNYSFEILKGASNILKKTKFLQIEINFDNIYNKSDNIFGIFEIMKKNNFKLIGIVNPDTNKLGIANYDFQTGALIGFDAIFIKK